MPRRKLGIGGMKKNSAHQTNSSREFGKRTTVAGSQFSTNGQKSSPLRQGDESATFSATAETHARASELNDCSSFDCTNSSTDTDVVDLLYIRNIEPTTDQLALYSIPKTT